MFCISLDPLAYVTNQMNSKAAIEVLSSQLNASMVNDRYGRNAAMHAAMDGEHERLKQLIVSKECNLEDVDNDGWTCLFYAAAAGQPKCVKTLVDLGANTKHKSNRGITALDYAYCDLCRSTSNEMLIECRQILEKKQQ